MSLRFEQKLSKTGLRCLRSLNQPKKSDMWKVQNLPSKKGEKRDYYFINTDFENILESTEISIGWLRELMRRELYGVAGVFYDTCDHSYNFTLDTTPKNASNWETRYTMDGRPVQAQVKHGKKFQTGLYIPPEIKKNNLLITDTGDKFFQKDVPVESLEVLRYIYDRTQELRLIHGNNWYPGFTQTEISNKTGIEVTEATELTKALIGITCETRNMYRGNIQYFLPKSRYDFVERVLQTY